MNIGDDGIAVKCWRVVLTKHYWRVAFWGTGIHKNYVAFIFAVTLANFNVDRFQ